MPINDFKPFAAGPGANVTSQADWENLPALLSGFMSGKASSAQMNKAFRQASFIAAALAQFVSEKTDQDVLDDGDLPGFVEKLTAGFAAQYLSRSNPFGDIASDGPEAIETALANLQLGEAAKRDVGDSGNQIPDMSYFTKSTAGGAAIVFTLPGGMIIQCGNIGTLAAGASVTVTYPIPFPLAMGFVIPAAAVSADSTTPVALAIDATVVNSRTGIVFRNCSTRLNLGTRYLAIGY
ncbi:hypothetical protein ABK948_18255 [Citrobacter sp. 70972423]|uniref:gp53-like domain-containing protein n=1 Tax=Citrobacter sp. 70972423 TaxID=3118148 RepID=UPI0037540601